MPPAEHKPTADITAKSKSGPPTAASAVPQATRHQPRLLNIILRILLVAGGAVLFCSCANRPEEERIVTFTGPTMGTQYTIKTVGLPEGISVKLLQEQVDALLHRINQQMSTYLDDSELSRFNRSLAGEWLKVSRDTAVVVQAAQQISASTQGAFDVTVGPLVDLWNFGPARDQPALPGDAQIESVRIQIGFEKLQFRIDPPALRKSVAGLRVDLSAIAKGFAVDAVAELLDARKIEHYMVEIGGEVRTKGARPGQEGWRIGIESPRIDHREIARVVLLENVAMATSGDYRNFFEIEGQRFSHTIDPRTGRPVKHQLASVTVVSADCMTADALATALMVMGPDAGLAWADQHAIAALLILRTEKGFVQRASRRFIALLDREKP